VRKISLDVDALEVESFDTAERGAEERGTVHANATNAQTQCARCPSGPYPCEQSYAMTDGIAVCQCAEGTGLCTD
jgi:hypothetical protein